MFRLIKQIFISALMYFTNLSSVNSLECVSLKNQENIYIMGKDFIKKSGIMCS